MMKRCWHEDPLLRPTFTELREDLDEIMCQEGIYFSFDFDEDSIQSDVEEDGVNAGATANGPTIVEVAVHCEHSELISVEESAKVTSV